MPTKLSNFFSAGMLAVLLMTFPAAHADKLCLQVTVAKKTGKVSTKKTIAPACPKGFTELVDTASFVGPQGAAGASGARGPSAFDQLPSGTTVRGVIGGWGNQSNLAFFTQSLPASSSTAIKSSDMIIAHTPRLIGFCEDSYGAGGITTCLSADELAKNETLCTGTFDNPTAPAGKVCIYPDVFFAGFDMEAQLVAASANPAEGSPFGFGLQWYTEPSSTSKLKASWAYTAP